MLTAGEGIQVFTIPFNHFKIFHWFKIIQNKKLEVNKYSLKLTKSLLYPPSLPPQSKSLSPSHHPGDTVTSSRSPGSPFLPLCTSMVYSQQDSHSDDVKRVRTRKSIAANPTMAPITPRMKPKTLSWPTSPHSEFSNCGIPRWLSPRQPLCSPGSPSTPGTTSAPPCTHTVSHTWPVLSALGLCFSNSVLLQTRLLPTTAHHLLLPFPALNLYQVLIMT